MTLVLVLIPLAAAAAFCEWLAFRGTPWRRLLPWLALPARLVMPHQGHHRDKYATDTPAPGAEPGQAPSPAPLSKAPEAAPRAGAAGAGPAPSTPGQGQHPYRPVIMQFPGGEVGILGADGRWHIKPLAWQPGVRETGGLPALVRGPYASYEAWRDAAVNQ